MFVTINWSLALIWTSGFILLLIKTMEQPIRIAWVIFFCFEGNMFMICKILTELVLSRWSYLKWTVNNIIWRHKPGPHYCLRSLQWITTCWYSNSLILLLHMFGMFYQSDHIHWILFSYDWRILTHTDMRATTRHCPLELILTTTAW